MIRKSSYAITCYTLALLTLLLSCTLKEELGPTATLLKENAIPIKDLSTLNEEIYKEIEPYEVIMVGEMHGTKEPSTFAYGLCQLIADKEDQVILGLEIPQSQMDDYSHEMSLEELKQLTFFQAKNTCGMNGEAWLQLIAQSNQNERIIPHFIDTWRFGSRDSSMYANICDIRKAYPNAKIVTLTGNVHNWLKPYKNKLKLGAYLANDSINFDPSKIMSINHIFSEGTMLNNMGNGLELTTIEKTESIYSQTISSTMYFSKVIKKTQNQYTHLLYTQKVNHSNKIKTNHDEATLGFDSTP